MNSNYALPRGSRVLVTGANGFIASHVVDQLLGLGYVVLGTVRSPKPWLNEYFANKYGPHAFQTALLSSLGDEASVEGVLDSVDGVVHLASDLTFGSDPNAIIPWVVQATLNILELASQRPSIKRVVLASSSSATYQLSPEPNGRRLTSDTWNDTAVKAAWDPNTPEEQKGVAVYAASKTEGERQSWKWIEDNKPQFVFNSVLPCFTVGRILHREIPGSTMGWTRKLLVGDDTAFSRFPEQWFVDVEDTARLCVIALLDRNVKSERIFAFSEQTNWTDTIVMLRELRPGNEKIPDPPKDELRDRTEVVPRTRAEELLCGFFGVDGFTSVRDSIEMGIEGW